MKSQRQRSAARKRRDRQDHFACQERESYRCQRCGAMSTQTHHAARKYPSVRHNHRWHIACCEPCHTWFHANPNAEREWLQHRGLWPFNIDPRDDQ